MHIQARGRAHDVVATVPVVVLKGVGKLARNTLRLVTEESLVASSPVDLDVLLDPYFGFVCERPKDRTLDIRPHDAERNADLGAEEARADGNGHVGSYLTGNERRIGVNAFDAYIRAEEVGPPVSVHVELTTVERTGTGSDVLEPRRPLILKLRRKLARSHRQVALALGNLIELSERLFGVVLESVALDGVAVDVGRDASKAI